MKPSQKFDSAFFDAQVNASDIPPAQRAQNIADAFNSGAKGQEEYINFRAARETANRQLGDAHLQGQLPPDRLLGFLNKVMLNPLPSPGTFRELQDAFQELTAAHSQRVTDTRDMQARFRGFADTFNLLADAEKKMRDMPFYVTPATQSAEMAAQGITALQSEQEYLAKTGAAFAAVTPFMKKLETYIENREKLLVHLANGMATTAPVAAPGTARFRAKKL